MRPTTIRIMTTQKQREDNPRGFFESTKLKLVSTWLDFVDVKDTNDRMMDHDQPVPRNLYWRRATIPIVANWNLSHR